MLSSLIAGAQPSTGMANRNRLQPTVEDCFSDDDHGHGGAIGPFTPEPFTPEPSPGKANVRTKRSNPEDMGTDKTPTTKASANIEVKSDSGYSSQSVAGMSSADSAASAASSQRSPPTVAAQPSPSPAQKPRPAHARQQSSNTETRYTLPRRESQSQRQRPVVERPARSNAPPQPAPAPAPVPKRRDSRNDECTIPGCTKCGPAAVEPRPRPSRRQSMLQPQPAESAPNVSYPHVYDNRSQVSDPADYPGSAPRDERQRMYHGSQGGPVIQPAISRRLSVNTRPTRPLSYHGEPNPNYNWSQPGMHSPHPSTPHEHGPPPSRSAYGNVHPYSQPLVNQMNNPYMPQYPPPGPPPAAFYQVQQMQPPRDPQRPPLQARAQTSAAYGYPAQPIVHIEHSGRPMPSARYHSNTMPSLAAQRQQPRIGYHDQEEDDSESSSEAETESEEEPEYPPQRPRGMSTNGRPRLPHAKTTPAPPMHETRRPQTIVVPDRRARVSDRDQDIKTSRHTSRSRPPLVPSIKSQSAYETPKARVLVEGSRASRRESLHAYDRTFQEHRQARQREYPEPARTKRSSKVYDNGVDYERDYHDDDDEADPVARATHRRRETEIQSRRRSHRPVESRQAAVAEDYINARRGGGEAVADVSYEVAKNRSSRTSGGPSEPESSRSRGSGDNNGEIRLRIGNDAPVTLSLNGDMEGRTLQLVPIENGMNELVISSNGRGGESTYRSETRSFRGDRRAITSASQARRDAEEMTERSSHSSHRRRQTRGEEDEPRRVLHRSNRRKEQGGPEYRK